MSIIKFIEDIREEKEGFKIDQPWRLDEKSLGVIIPILRIIDKERDYITFAEAKDAKAEDTGQIDYVYVKNNDDKSLYISRGEIFRGKTQERAAVHGHIIAPGKGLRVAVRCIHASKGIKSGEEMKYGGKTPYTVTFGNQRETWDSVTYTTCNMTGRGTSAQLRGTVPNGCEYPQAEWATYSSPSLSLKGIRGPGVYSAVLGASGAAEANVFMSQAISASDDLVSTLDDLSDNIREVMKKIPFIENQVGAAFFKENDLLGMDVYDLAGSWDSVKKEVCEKEGSSFISKDSDSMFDFKPEKGKAMLAKKLDQGWEEKTIYDKEYKVVELRGKELLGEAIEFNGNVIHLTLWKKSK